MAERVPAITLTDPNNHEEKPSTPLSPIKDAVSARLSGSPERPTTPNGRVSSDRPGSSGWASPGRLIRSLSHNAGRSNSPGPVRDESNGMQETQQTLPAAIDPLSQHILKRTNASIATQSTLQATSEGTNSEDGRRGSDQTHVRPVQALSRTDTADSSIAPKDLRKGVKGVSFISRLIGNKKKEDQVPADDESTSNEGRPEGNDAEVFAQPVDNIGFNPLQPHPPAYIKMRSKQKKERDFDRLFLAQELECRKRQQVERQSGSKRLRRKSSTPTDANTIWALEFSRDGKYLAAAGVDGVVSIWAVLSSSEDRQKHEQQEASENEAKVSNAHAEHLSAPVFQTQPIREFEGHTSTVLDLSWSKNNFLLSSSMDKTVRLWHVSRAECLCTFQHNDFVPSIAFHPKDDRFFIAGSLDSKLRLWSIPDKSVAYTAKLSEMITAVAFTPDGKYAMAGCLSGLCMFYETEGLKYQSQVHVRSARGQNAKGSKITGIQAFQNARGDIKLLITSNDSRVRLYNFRDKNLELKFRGSVNNYSQIRAAISADGRYVTCGSEDRKAYIWSMGPADNERRDKRQVEMFEANDSITTFVRFAPTKTRLLLSRSEDPIYDLCNPPPVTLLSRHERAESQSSSRPQSANGSIQPTPSEFEGKFERPKEPASFLSRSSHKEGNIIVTADFTGNIKVFRQDCAWSKRRLDDWDRSSIFGKRNGRVSRTGSVQTRGSRPSLRESRKSASISGPSERIMNWRQGIVSTPSISGDRRRSSKNSSRNESPTKTPDTMKDERKASAPRSNPDASLWDDRAIAAKSTTPSKSDAGMSAAQARQAANGSHAPDSPRSSSARDREDSNPLKIEGGRSYLFWDTDEWKGQAKRMQQAHHDAELAHLEAIPSRDDIDLSHLAVRPPMARGETAVSELSDEHSSGSNYGDAPEEQAPEMKCRRCGSLSFTARKSFSGTKLECSKCGERFRDK